MKQNTRGFTLIELLLAMTILVLVMGAVFATMQTGMRLYQSGIEQINAYQSARIALRTMTEQLQFSLADNQVRDGREHIRRMSVEQAMMSFGGMLIEEEDIAAVRFLGETNEVVFCRKVYQFGKVPPFDIQECRFVVENGQLHLDVLRSLTMVSQAVWFYQSSLDAGIGRVIAFQGNQQINFRQVNSLDEPPIAAFVGDYGVLNYRQTIADGIKKMSLRYSSGDGWRGGWDSEVAEPQYRRSPQSPNYDPNQDEIFQKKGPPQLVEVQLTLYNDDVLATVIEVPAGSLNIGANAVLTTSAPGGQRSQQTNTRTTNETPFAVP